MKKRVSIIGAGSWGTALASVIVDNGHDVLLWTRSDDHAAEINEQHTNKRYLPEVTLSPKIIATSDLKAAVAFSPILCFVVPTSAMREIAQQVVPYIDTPKYVIHASKGIERETYLRISQLLKNVLQDKQHSIVALSGPSHAEEVIRHDITSITAASDDLQQAQYVQKLFMNEYFRVYTNTDIIGVEMGAALKNIIAIGSGIITGLGYGDNARAALITRGLAEMTRLGVAIGASSDTFSGLSGVGDLIVTCMSSHSRNFKAGKLIGSGRSTAQMLADIGVTIEGVYTVSGAYQLAKEYGLDVPIIQALYRVLHQQKSPNTEIYRLMMREGKSE